MKEIRVVSIWRCDGRADCRRVLIRPAEYKAKGWEEVRDALGNRRLLCYRCRKGLALGYTGIDMRL